MVIWCPQVILGKVLWRFHSEISLEEPDWLSYDLSPLCFWHPFTKSVCSVETVENKILEFVRKEIVVCVNQAKIAEVAGSTESLEKILQRKAKYEQILIHMIELIQLADESEELF